MTTVIGKPLIVDVQDTTEVVELQIITRPEEWEGTFNRIEVWRSLASPAGPYEALTADQWEPAILPNTAVAEPETPVVGRQVQLNGLQLLLNVDGTTDYVVSFSTPGYESFQQATQDITAQGAGAFTAYVDGNGNVVLVGTHPGTGASLQITGGDAAPLLGLPTLSPDNLAYGRDAHITLVKGNNQYVFTDQKGSKQYFYRTRFLNATTRSVSEFSPPFSVGQALGINPANVVHGYIELVATDGRPLANQLVQVYAPTQTSLVEGKLVSGPRQAKYTDANGYVGFTLVRGVKYTVSITGTDLVREFTAPTDPTVKNFSPFDKTVGFQDDLFTVDRPPLVYAERRSF